MVKTNINEQKLEMHSGDRLRDLNVFSNKLRIWGYPLCWNPKEGRSNAECIAFTKTSITSIMQQDTHLTSFFQFSEIDFASSKNSPVTPLKFL